MLSLLHIFFCIAVLFCAAECKANATIALVVPKAGNYEQQGTELTKGVQQAVTEINENGGLLGEKISLLTVDDQCNDGISVSTAQMLALQKDAVRLVIGPYCANSFDTVADIYAKAQIFQIIPTTVNYTQARTIKKGLVKMLGYTHQQATDFFNFYNANFAGENVAVISNVNDSESTEEAAAVAAEFRKHGKSVVLKEYSYDMTATDYAKLAEIILNDGNTTAFVLGFPKNIRKMAYALKDRAEDIKLFVNKYTAGNDFFEYMGDLTDGVYFMALSGREDDPEFAETLVKLRLNGFDAEGLSLYGYSAVNLWKSLVEISRSFDYNKLSANLNNKKIKTEFGSQMFHNGAPDTNENYAIYLYDRTNSSLEKVY